MIMQKQYKPDFIKSLIKVQKDIDPILKDASNTHFKSKYATLSSVLKSIAEKLNENGFTLIQPLYVDEHGNNCITTIILHENGESITAESKLIFDKNTNHGFGSAITYTRRYQLTSLLGVCSEDDDDGNIASLPKKGKITQWQIEEIKKLIKDGIFREEKILSNLKVNSLEDLKEEQFNKLVSIAKGKMNGNS